MKFRELEGVEDGVKICGVGWWGGHYIYWDGSRFLDEDDEFYHLKNYDLMRGDWVYYKKPEPELFCPICGGKIGGLR